MAERRVLLHVGTPKTGTTSLQARLHAHPRPLARAGVLYPGRRPDAHFLSALDLQRVGFNDAPAPARAGLREGAWDRLVREAVAASAGTTVVSHELFGDADAADAARAVRDLSAAGEVHVVVTARDLARQVPAAWQEDVKNRHTMRFSDFLDAVRPGGPRAGEWYGTTFWRRQDVPAVLARWSAGLPPQRVHVVTVPPRGAPPDLLWQRFATLLPPGLAALPAPDEGGNASLGVVEAQLVHRLNGVLGERLGWPAYGAAVTHRLAPELLGLRAGSRPIPVPAHERGWLAERSRAQVDALAAAGYHVVGDLDDLLVPAGAPAGAAGEGPDQVGDGELLDVALDALATVLDEWLPRSRGQRLRAAARRLPSAALRAALPPAVAAALPVGRRAPR